MKYRRELDGLRSLAVLPVILFHAGVPLFQGGFVGVDVFFVISGYLITSIVLTETAEGRFSLATFYERRFRRILPALFFVMVCTAVMAYLWLMPAEMKAFSQSVSAVTLFGANLLFWWTSGYFDAASELKPLLHTWSLGVEEQYYVFLPLVIMGLWRIGRSRSVFGVLAAASVLSFAASVWMVGSHQMAAFYLLPFRAWELLAGSLIACHLSSPNYRQPALKQAQWGAWLGLLMLAVAVFGYDKSVPFPGAAALVPVLATVCIIVFADQRTMVGRILSLPPFVMVGLISYSAYLWHNPLFAFARVHSELPLESGALMWGLSLLSLVLAYFTWKYVEAPFRERSRFSRRQVLGFSVGTSALLCAAGVAGHFYFQARTPVYDYKWSEYTRQHQCLLQEDEADTHAADCVPPRQAGRLNVLLWGDSHAASLYQGLRSFADKQGWTLAQLNQSGCVPLLEANNMLRNNCADINRRIFNHLPTQHFDVIVLHSIWYFDRAPMPASEIGRHLDSTLDAVRKASPNSRIVVVGNVPRWYISAQRALKHADAAVGEPLYRRALLLPELEQELAAVAAKHGAGFVRPSNYLCRSLDEEGTGWCLLSGNGSLEQLFYTDADHLSKTGADWLMSRMGADLLHEIGANKSMQKQ